jgi:hypothetical protein
MDGLAEDLEAVAGYAEVGELINAVRNAKTDLMVALDRVNTWFRRARAVVNEPFPIADAVELSAELVRLSAPRFTARVASAPVELLRGELFMVFVDIFFILFENVAKHSGITTELVADVSVEVADQALHISVENDVHVAGPPPGALDRIRKIRQEWNWGLTRNLSAAKAVQGYTSY